MDTSPNLQLAYLMAAQSQKHVTYNEAMRALDALVQQAVLDKDLTAPPSSPADGDRYIVAASPTGAWAGQAGRVAAYQDGAWAFYPPREGWLAWVADEDVLYVHDGAAWQELSIAGGAALDALGALTPAADRLPYFTGASAATLATFTSFGRSLIDDADAAAALATLGIPTGTSGHAIPYLDAANTWSAQQTWSRATDAILATFTNSSNSASADLLYKTSGAGTVRELVLRNSESGLGVLGFQNDSASGYSAIQFRSSSGFERSAIGFGNPSATSPIFQGRNYWETWNSGVVTNLAPELFLGYSAQVGRSGTAGNPRNYQRLTIDDLGTHLWKAVPWGNGTEQVKIAEFHEGGHFAVLNVTEPAAIDIPNSAIAFWFDDTAASPDLRFKARDSAGALYAGSVAISSAISAAVSDDFSEADDDDTLTAGKAADAGGNWAAADSDNWGVASNKAYRSGGSNDSYAYIDSSLADVCVECDITLSSVRASAGIVIGGVDASNYTVVQLKRGTANELNLFTCVGGSFTQITPFGGLITSAGLALNTTYAVRVGRAGNSVFVDVDGVRRARWESGTHKTATRQGIWSYIGGADDDGGSRWDNFKVFA